MSILPEDTTTVHERGESGEIVNGFILKFAVGLAGAAGIAAAARRANALTQSGMIAASLVGGVVFAAAGIRGSAGLIVYFISSTIFGRLPSASPLAQARGNTRDAVQVFANGGVATALAILSAVGPERILPRCRAGFAGAIAAVAADTWATEIGSRSPETPRSIVTLRPTSIGDSGSVTIAGLLASAAGASLMARMLCDDTSLAQSNLAAASGGFMGSLADSILGATVQETRFCDICLQPSELAVCCGEPTSHLRGFPGINNDTVNALASAVGALVAMTAFNSHGDVGASGQDATPVPQRTIWRILEIASRRGV